MNTKKYYIIFFFQACRGGEFDYGVHMKVGKDEVDARPENSIEFNPCPIYKDFLIMYATPPGKLDESF